MVIDRLKQTPYSIDGSFNVVFDTAAAYSYFALRKRIATGGAFMSTVPSPLLFLGKVAVAMSSKRCGFSSVKSDTPDLEQLATWLQEELQAPIDSIFPVSNLDAALARLNKGEVYGRIVIQVDGGF